MSALAQRASAAYVVYAPDTKHPVEVAGSESGHLAAWLSKRMNMTFSIPQLNDVGFVLVGGRLMVGDTAPAAMLMYENKQGRRIVLYVRNDLPDDHPSKMHYRHTDTGGIVYWRDTAVGFGLAGGFTEQELMPVANLIKRGFSS
jgi:anti-sigma factor RsiW